MGYAISLDSKHIPVGFVVEKSSKYSLSLTDAFRMSDSFDVKLEIIEKIFKMNFKKGTIRAIIIIPSTFAKDLEILNPKIQILIDGTEPNIAGFVRKYSNGVF